MHLFIKAAQSSTHATIVSMSIALSIISTQSFAKDDVIEQLPKSEAINLILGEVTLSDEERKQVAEKISKGIRDRQELASSIDDDVEPIRAPIYISADPAADPATIYVAKSRPTTISFFKQGGGTLPVTRIQTQFKDQDARFEAKAVEGMDYAYSFRTSVWTGWTSVDFFFEGVPYSIPVKLVAGRKYHSSAQGVLIETQPQGTHMTGELPQKAPTDNEFEAGTSSSINSMTTTLYSYANYAKIPQDSTTSSLEITFFESTSGVQPQVSAIQTLIENKEYFLLRTNGILTYPDYTASEPANTPNETIWAYAIPKENITNAVSISYRGGTNFVSVTEYDSIGVPNNND